MSLTIGLIGEYNPAVRAHRRFLGGAQERRPRQAGGHSPA